MKTHEHAAQLAEALRKLLDTCELNLDEMEAHTRNQIEGAAIALAAWDRHNAPPPEQQALL